MKTAEIPGEEPARLAAVRELCEPASFLTGDFADLTELAAHICGAPIALITVVEKQRQRFATKFGLRADETPRDHAFCAHAILEPGLFIVPDAKADPRFADNPLVTGEPYIRFYAGAPLTTTDGLRLGTLCVIDREPRELNAQQKLALQVLSRHVVSQLELRRSNEARREAEAELQRAKTLLERRVVDRTEELLHERNRLELAISSSNIGMWEWDLVAKTVFLSTEWKRQLGYRPDELSDFGAGWEEWIHPHDRTHVLSALQNYLANPSGEYECELRFRHKDGSYRWLLSRARMIFDAEKRPVRMVGCHIDITDRRHMEEKLRQTSEQLRALVARHQTDREAEGARLARELHDELGANLTGLKMDVAAIDRRISRALSPEVAAPLKERLNRFSEMLDATIDSVRRVCRVLRPAMLDELGLPAAIEWQVNDFRARTGIHCVYVRPEILEIEPARATALFRVVQELLTNVARHARPKSARVELRREDGSVHVVVQDDGRGLPVDLWTHHDRFGLLGVQERILSIQGMIEFSSPAGGGTRVDVWVPCV